MRQVVITKAGAPEVLQVRESADPVPQAGEVRVRVRAAGINFADLMARLGLYPDAPKIPCVVGYEVSGVVDEVGAGVTTCKPGDRVLAVPYFGVYSDVVVVPEAQAFVMPDEMTFEEGAGFPVVYLTAHHMLLHVGTLRRGDRVFIHSAAGGVGIAAIQIAKTRGCEILGTASASKHDFLREIGCAHPMPYEGWAKQVRSIVGERGVDVVLDPVGGGSWKEGYRLLGPGGRLVCFGMSANAEGKTRSMLHVVSQLMKLPLWNPITLMNQNRTVSGVNMGHLFGRIDILRPQIEALIDMYRKGQIKPHIDRSFPFAEAAAAHHYLHDRKAKGKVVLVP